MAEPDDGVFEDMAAKILEGHRSTLAAQPPGATGALDALMAYVRDTLERNGVDVADPVAAQALMVVSGAAQEVLHHYTGMLRQQEGLIQAVNTVHAAAIMAARHQVDDHG